MHFMNDVFVCPYENLLPPMRGIVGFGIRKRSICPQILRKTLK